jgi:outer membrane biosynthesis protein TonB
MRGFVLKKFLTLAAVSLAVVAPSRQANAQAIAIGVGSGVGLGAVGSTLGSIVPPVVIACAVYQGVRYCTKVVELRAEADIAEAEKPIRPDPRQPGFPPPVVSGDDDQPEPQPEPQPQPEPEPQPDPQPNPQADDETIFDPSSEEPDQPFENPYNGTVWVQDPETGNWIGFEPVGPGEIATWEYDGSEFIKGPKFFPKSLPPAA